jgi:hypothetical protein
MDVPVPDRAEELQRLLTRLSSLDDAIAEERSTESALLLEADRHWKDEQALHQQLHDLLVAEGVCPTCGQRVSDA